MNLIAAILVAAMLTEANSPVLRNETLETEFVVCGGGLAGVDFVCVLSGETTREDLKRYSGTPPALVVNTFDEVCRAFEAVVI